MYFSAFSEVYLLSENARAIARIERKTVQEDEKGLKSEEEQDIGKVFSISKNKAGGSGEEMLILQLDSDLDDQFSNDLSQEVLSTFMPGSVIVLFSAPLTSYKTDDPELRDEQHITRCLQTGDWNQNKELKIELLERPNVVGGIAAARKHDTRRNCNLWWKLKLILLFER